MNSDGPRIRKVQGEDLWVCTMTGHDDGYGSSPEEAYDDWRDKWFPVKQKSYIVPNLGSDSYFVTGKGLAEKRKLDLKQDEWFKGLRDDIPNLIREVKQERGKTVEVKGLTHKVLASIKRLYRSGYGKT